MDKQDTRITVKYHISTSGVAFYDEEDSAKIRAYMEETHCSVETAIWELAAVDELAGFPEEIGYELKNDCTYTEAQLYNNHTYIRTPSLGVFFVMRML